MTETTLPRTTRRAIELGHDAAALFHEQTGAAYERAADIWEVFGDDSRSAHFRERAAAEHDAAGRERGAAARSRAISASPEGRDSSASSEA